jgi:ubiquinone/menaquinone biosynthesis C-methylase UbiE
MREKPIKLYLKKVEEYRLENNLSRPDMADELGIPLKTYENWCRRTKRKTRPYSKYTGWIKRFLESREIISAERFLKKDGPNLLEKIGFRKGQTVVDFGSGGGDYSLILARIVGKKGRIYAVDKSRNVLGELMGRAYGKSFRNIEDKFVSRGKKTPTEIPLPDESIDAIWFSDVLHDGYFKRDKKKEELLRDVYRTLKKEGFIAIHPVHMDEKRLKRVIKSTGFYLEKEYQEIILFHGNEFHKASVFKFKKRKGKNRDRLAKRAEAACKESKRTTAS